MMMRRIVTLWVFAAALGSAQPKLAIQPADYGKWETMGQTVLSADGKWLAAPIKRGNGTAELRIHPAGGGKALVAAGGTEPLFSSNSRWAAYAVGYSGSGRGQAQEGQEARAVEARHHGPDDGRGESRSTTSRASGIPPIRMGTWRSAATRR